MVLIWVESGCPRPDVARHQWTAKRALYQVSVPLAARRRGRVGRIEERQQGCVRIWSRSHGSVREHELMQVFMEVGRFGLHRLLGKAVGAGVSVAVEHRLVDTVAARPEPGRGHLVAVRLLGDDVG